LDREAEVGRVVAPERVQKHIRTKLERRVAHRERGRKAEGIPYRVHDRGSRFPLSRLGEYPGSFDAFEEAGCRDRHRGT
jgi:hypothetical protein